MKSIQQIEELRKEFREFLTNEIYHMHQLELHDEFNDLEYKEMAIRPIADFWLSKFQTLLQEIIKKGEENKKKCRDDFEKYEIEAFNSGIDTALEPIRAYLEIINKEE